MRVCLCACLLTCVIVYVCRCFVWLCACVWMRVVCVRVCVSLCACLFVCSFACAVDGSSVRAVDCVVCACACLLA